MEGLKKGDLVSWGGSRLYFGLVLKMMGASALVYWIWKCSDGRLMHSTQTYKLDKLRIIS